MRRRPLIWLLVSIACFIGAFYFWRMGEEWHAAKKAAKTPAATTPSSPLSAPREGVKSASTAPIALLPLAQRDNTPTTGPLSPRELLKKYRVSNTTKTAGQLSRSDQAILLANALIDSSLPIQLNIPDSLRSEGDPGTYVVQARGPIDDFFRDQLKGAGASIVSYIPNNAYLVRVSESGAQQLASVGGLQSVIPFEPYYKIPDPKLLALAVEGDPLPSDLMLNVVAFADARQEAMDAIKANGGEIIDEERTPFGPSFKVHAKPDSLTTLARLPSVQTIEAASPRTLANDLSRPRVGVARTSITNANHLGLTGSNIVVNVNDSGVDTNHPDLLPRVFTDSAFSGIDSNGHGTHVAGIIGSSGVNSTGIKASGSVAPPIPLHFRGMANNVRIFAASIFTNVHDTELQENAARTNSLISNNSWNYGSSQYDTAAANFDAAVRDALPGESGSQPLVIVFSAGDAGNGSTDGAASSGESVRSPATAKNVITVGAIEQLRNITNTIKIPVPGTTNFNTETPWLPITDSDSQVASFSSRGNVGIDVEGEFGRFKPDLVAPGTFVVSTRSQNWDQGAYYNPTSYFFRTEVTDVKVGEIETDLVFLPYNAVELLVSVDALVPEVDLPVYVRQAGPPTATTYDYIGTNFVLIPGPTPVDALWFFGVGNPTNQGVRYEFTVRYALTNERGNYFQVLSNLNNSITPSNTSTHLYRYESGTSMSAADVSGVLALMGEYFSNNLIRPSPALMKAMLINGARSFNSKYDLQVQKTVNDQGWGLVNFSNSVPSGITNGAVGTPTGAMLFFEQNATNGLATGDRHTYNIQVRPSAVNQPLRISVVWTDPPGNPSAGIKLVNDIDLVVTNLNDTSQVYYGNDIPNGSTVNFAWDTNLTANIDNINNVENVFLDVPVATNYSITVIGHRINVNAVTAHTNNVVQDYALVISSGNGRMSNAITLGTKIFALTNDLNITIVTNDFPTITNISGQLLLNQHVGAYSPLVGLEQLPVGTNSIWKNAGTNGVITLGATNQWHFYVMTNTTTFTNAAFATFLAQTIAVPRMGPTNYIRPLETTRPEADIDMFVSKDPALLQLDPAVLAAADKSLSRRGTELIAYTNAAQDEVYYIGIHCEDRQAGEYAFFGVFSELPFSQSDSNGVLIRGINVPAIIPEGPPDKPGGVMVIGIALQPTTIRRVIVTNVLTHENVADLFGVLDHDRIPVVLHSHSCAEDPITDSCYTNFTYVYEDNGENTVAGSRNTDGPGRLTDYIGLPGEGIWLLTEVDNSLLSTGRVDELWIRLEPQDDLGAGTVLDIAPNSFGFLSVDVPPEATNMTICVVNESTSPAPLQLYVRRGDLPSQTNFDFTIPIPVTGACLSINRTNFPPLQAGRYFIGVFNPNNFSQRVRVFVTLDLDPNGVTPILFNTYGPIPILDDAVTYSSTYVPYENKIIRVDVGVAIQHPRVSDLALTLISPLGKRILLFENRGGTNAADLGNVVVTTNFLGTITGQTNNLASTNILAPVPSTGILVLDYDFFTAPDSLDVFFSGTNILSTGLISGAGSFTIPYGPGPGNSLVIVINQNNNPNNPGTAWEYTPRIISQEGSYFIFSENTNFTALPIKFAVPPFLSTNSAANTNASTNVVMIDGFENTAGNTFNIPLGTFVSGWQVQNGNIDVLTTGYQGSTAHSGTNYIDLNGSFNEGTIVTNFATVVGQQYRLSFAYSRNQDVPIAALGVTVGGSSFNVISSQPVSWASLNWQTISTVFIASSPITTLQMEGLTGSGFGMLLDTIQVQAESSVATTNIGFGSYFFPEENLRALVGDFANGIWTLEMWDNRVGATNPQPILLSWQLRFILDTNVTSVTPLFNGIGFTNTIPQCTTQYFSVDVPSWAVAATNILISSTSPVNVWLNPNTLPLTGNTGDVALLTASIGGIGVPVLTLNSTPPLVPGTRYFLAVENPCGSGTNATFGIRVDFAANVIRLTNMIAYTNTLSASTNAGQSQAYVYTVTTNAARVQFEILEYPTANMTLVARRGLPPPSLFAFDYLSDNPITNGELIVLITNSTPIPLIPGDWYLTAINNGAGPATYHIMASEWPVTGRPFAITNWTMGSNSFCVTWESLPGVHYFIEGVPALGQNWSLASPTITAVDYSTTYCISLPSPFNFFRVGEGLALLSSTVFGPPPQVSGQFAPGGFLLNWTGPVTARYQVQWTPSITPLVTWNTFTNIVTSTNGFFSFLDDGTQSGGLGGTRVLSSHAGALRDSGDVALGETSNIEH